MQARSSKEAIDGLKHGKSALLGSHWWSGRSYWTSRARAQSLLFTHLSQVRPGNETK